MLEKICEILDIKIGEVWESKNGGYYLLDEGGRLWYRNTKCDKWISALTELPELLRGDIEPVVKFIPKRGDRYYTPSIATGRKYNHWVHENRELDKENIKLGLVYRTKEEAITRANEILKILEEY